MISELQYITQGKTSEEHLRNIEKACVSGVKWVQLRLKNVAPEIILETAKKAREITKNYQTKLIINDYYKIVKEVKADGVHLGKNDECPSKARAYLGDSYMIGGTANTLEDCKILLEKKVNYIGLGPFQFTKTKKNLSPILGIEGYKTINTSLKTNIPIIAIGGISLKNVATLINSGVYGIAISQEITRDFNRISDFYKILKSSKQHKLVKQ
ncbi:thiamine phosphate synthase [Polaribacter batillariae]|uniref:Thiamine-phosphate synthase n=1 Tax=Polaribacter batillariae TaxID=2808900 RepID=A0ABX7SYW6_9FLAO|nr:thiamine phosphate synthase [Polaribacter batillariae]QTD37994.1 thiamine phosphate synthase [Polaribacter batillariae]